MPISERGLLLVNELSTIRLGMGMIKLKTQHLRGWLMPKCNIKVQGARWVNK